MLPPFMSLEQIWCAADGTVIEVRELFLGDLRRLAALPRSDRGQW